MNFDKRAKLPQKVFRAGSWTSDTGQVHSYDSTFVQQLAENYDPDLKVANFVEGHPADNQPSYGVVASAFVDNDGWLVVVPRKMEQNFVEKVSKEQSPWSLSILPVGHPDNPITDGPYINHVGRVPKGFQPGVKGQPHQPMQFCESNGVINFYMADDKPNTPESVTPVVAPISTEGTDLHHVQAQQFAVLQQQVKDQAELLKVQGEQLKAQAERNAQMALDAANLKAQNFIQLHRTKLSGNDIPEAQALLSKLYLDDASNPISFTAGDKQVSVVAAVEKLISGRQSLVPGGRLELENFIDPTTSQEIEAAREKLNAMHGNNLIGGQ